MRSHHCASFTPAFYIFWIIMAQIAGQEDREKTTALKGKLKKLKVKEADVQSRGEGSYVRAEEYSSPTWLPALTVRNQTYVLVSLVLFYESPNFHHLKQN